MRLYLSLTCYALATTALLCTSGISAYAQSQAPATPAVKNGETSSSESMSLEEWDALPQEERQARARRGMVSRYEPSGKPSADKLDVYVDRYASFNVYDPRYYLFKVKAKHVEGTTVSVELSGDSYPGHYKEGVENALRSLNFNVVKNDIRALPLPGMDYGVSTTAAATIRKEPRRSAEQVNSVGMGGWVRFLRTAEASDITAENHARRHAPGADKLPDDTPEDWALAQSMEGYLGFVRKADFIKQAKYRLPDGIVKMPVKPEGWTTEVPAGVFVYGSPEAGWHLFEGALLPASASVRDLRPNYNAEEIEALMKPFMATRYVWGGVTDEGIDCSGFSQYFMRTEGVLIPRDAAQQATSGLIVGWGPKQIIENAKPGDLIFYANETGRIGHVSISLGGSRIIHSAGHGVHISDMDKPSENDTDGTYGRGPIFARRINVR